MMRSPVIMYTSGPLTYIVMNSKMKEKVVSTAAGDPEIPVVYIDRLGIVPVIELDEACREDLGAIFTKRRKSNVIGN